MHRGDEWPSLWLAGRDRLTGPRAYKFKLIASHKREEAASISSLHINSSLGVQWRFKGLLFQVSRKFFLPYYVALLGAFVHQGASLSHSQADMIAAALT